MQKQFKFNGLSYEGRRDIVENIEGLVATCETLGPDPKYVELEKAKAETFKPVSSKPLIRPKFKKK